MKRILFLFTLVSMLVVTSCEMSGATTGPGDQIEVVMDSTDATSVIADSAEVAFSPGATEVLFIDSYGKHVTEFTVQDNYVTTSKQEVTNQLGLGKSRFSEVRAVSVPMIPG